MIDVQETQEGVNRQQPGVFTDLIKKAALMGTCAAGAVTAGLVSSDLKQASAGGVVTGICGITAALGAGIALLSTHDPLEGTPGDHRRRRTRLAAMTKPLDPAASDGSLRDHHDDTAMLASTMIQMQQMSMEAEAEHLENDLLHHLSVPSSPREASVSSSHADDLELLNSYSRHFPEDVQLDQAPAHIMHAHQRLETMIDQMSYEDLCEHFGNDSQSPQSHRNEVKDAVSALPSSILSSSPSKDGASCSSSSLGDGSSSSGGIGFSEVNCPICLEDFEEGDEVRLLPRCNHCFHVACVDHWLLDHKENCPVCRRRI